MVKTTKKIKRGVIIMGEKDFTMGVYIKHKESEKVYLIVGTNCYNDRLTCVNAS